MATYVMSDVHGQQKAFNNILEQIKFSEKDKLYLLGDYVDWGDSSIELIQQIMEMQKQYDIQCLMGNHDWMMQKVIGMDFESIGDIYFDEWYRIWASNRGDETLIKYMELSKEDKIAIKKWLSELRYFIPDVEVNGQKYYLCHSKPFVKGMQLQHVVFDRIKNGRLPQQFKEGK